MARMKSRGGDAAAVRWSSLIASLFIVCRSLWLCFPAGGDLLALFSRQPDDHGFRACRPRPVPYRIRRLHVPGHAWLEDVALAVDDVIELAGHDVEHLDRAVLVIAGVAVRRKGDLAQRHLRTDVCFVQEQLQRGTARGAIGGAIGLSGLRLAPGHDAEQDRCRERTMSHHANSVANRATLSSPAWATRRSAPVRSCPSVNG